jgi:hypothetical protein
MFEEKEFLSEIEVALRDRTEKDLLSFMSCNIDGVIGKMTNLKNNINSELGSGTAAFDEATGRMYYVFSIFINLWNCRN